jgi:hypothetical protein
MREAAGFGCAKREAALWMLCVKAGIAKLSCYVIVRATRPRTTAPLNGPSIGKFRRNVDEAGALAAAAP